LKSRSPASNDATRPSRCTDDRPRRRSGGCRRRPSRVARCPLSGAKRT
jgi:hypothetical protein